MSRADLTQAVLQAQKLARMSRHLPTFILLLAITVLAGGGIFALYRFVLAKQPARTNGPGHCLIRAKRLPVIRTEQPPLVGARRQFYEIRQ